MARVFAVGETVYDLIFKNGKPVTARAGGSMLNTSVSLGRLGVEIYYISEYGTDADPVSQEIKTFLSENQVNTDYVNRNSSSKPVLALAFLNEKNDARYSFYKSQPEIRTNYPEISFEADDILLFGSFFSLSPGIRPMLTNLLKRASESGAIIVYDPNFREPHLSELPSLKPFILENLRFSDIVRGSDDDFYLIFNSNNKEEAFKTVNMEGNAALIYTQNRNGVDLLSFSTKLHLDVPDINPISTIGAGDSFNAGVIWSLVRDNISRKNLEHLSRKQWERMLSFGIRFAENVCMSYDNYISVEFAVEILSE